MQNRLFREHYQPEKERCAVDLEVEVLAQKVAELTECVIRLERVVEKLAGSCGVCEPEPHHCCCGECEEVEADHRKRSGGTAPTVDKILDDLFMELSENRR